MATIEQATNPSGIDNLVPADTAQPSSPVTGLSPDIGPGMFTISPLPGMTASPDSLRQFYKNDGIPRSRLIQPSIPSLTPIPSGTTVVNNVTNTTTTVTGTSLEMALDSFVMPQEDQLNFLSASGFHLTTTPGVSTNVSILAASSVQAGITSTAAQTFGGNKIFGPGTDGGLGFIGLAGTAINQSDIVGYVGCNLSVTLTNKNNEMRGYQSTINYTRTTADANVVYIVVNISGTTVTWVQGLQFITGGAWSGLTAYVNGVANSIHSVSSATSLTLNSSAGTLTNALLAVWQTSPTADTGAGWDVLGYDAAVVVKNMSLPGSDPTLRGQMKPFQSELYFLNPSGPVVYSIGDCFNYVASLTEVDSGIGSIGIWAGLLVGQPGFGNNTGNAPAKKSGAVMNGYGIWIQNLSDSSSVFPGNILVQSGAAAIKIDGLNEYGRISWNNSNIMEIASGTLQLFGGTQVQTAASCGLFVGGSTANAGLQCGSAVAFGPVVSSDQTGGSVPTASGYNAEFQAWLAGVNEQVGITTVGATGAPFMKFDHLGRVATNHAANTGQWQFHNGGKDSHGSLYQAMVLQADGSIILPEQGADEADPGTFLFDASGGGTQTTFSTAVLYFKADGLWYRLAGGSPVGPLVAAGGGGNVSVTNPPGFTTGKIPKATGSTTLADGIMTDTGSQITLSGTQNFSAGDGGGLSSGGFWVGSVQIITGLSGTAYASIGNVNAIAAVGTVSTSGHFDATTATNGYFINGAQAMWSNGAALQFSGGLAANFNQLGIDMHSEATIGWAAGSSTNPTGGQIFIRQYNNGSGHTAPSGSNGLSAQSGRISEIANYYDGTDDWLYVFDGVRTWKVQLTLASTP